MSIYTPKIPLFRDKSSVDDKDRSIMRSFGLCFKVFFRLSRFKLLILPILMIVTSLFEGFGIVMFLPLLERLQGGGSDISGNILLSTFSKILAFLHLNSLGGMLFFIAIIFLLKFLVLFLRGVYTQIIISDMYIKLSSRIIKGWERSDYRIFYLKNTTGYFPNLLLRELLGFIGTFDQFSEILVSMLYVVVALGFAFLLDAKVTLVAFLFGIATFGLFWYFNILARRYSLLLTEKYTYLQSRIIEFAQSYKYLKATNLFSRTNLLLARDMKSMIKTKFKMSVVGSFFSSISEPIAVLLVVVFLYFEIVVVQSSFSLIAILLLLFYRTLMRIMTLQTSWHKLISSSGSINAVLRSLESIENNKEPLGEINKKGTDQSIGFKNVCFSYNDQSTLTDINLCIAKNKTTALVGPSGGGKSTLVDLMIGVLKPEQGNILIDDVDYKDLDIRVLRNNIGYVTQDITVFNDTVLNNISFWDDQSNFSMDRIEQACRQAYCYDFIQQMPQRYETVVGDRGVNLSVGQRQRIAIARELYRNPSILIFDEATSALDTESEEYIQKSIEEIKGDKTLVVIAHRLSTIKNADYIYVIDKGRVLEEGTFDELYNNENTKFYHMCHLQSFE